MKTDASKPSRSSRKSDVVTIGNSAPISEDVDRPEVFNEEDALKKRARVIIRVGTGISQKVFHVESAILCGSPAFVRSYLENSMATSQLKDVELPYEDPIAAEMFVEWAKRPKRPIVYAPGQYSDEPWISNAAAAWLFGHRLDAATFKTYALSQFIQNCALAARGPWRLIEEKAPVQSPLLRFSDHWVAWNSSLSGPGVNEYTGLNAAKHTDQVKPSTRDPRTFDLNHWYLDCGNDINAKCTHDPIFRDNEQEKKRLRSRPPPPEWGVEYECAETNTISSPARAKHASPNSPSPLVAKQFG
ncbi:hypothetical protein MMC22_006209 [Lobaria immixta]|nr:hypothetical protein [Lobaria immixta]